MRTLARSLFASFLALCARAVLRKYRPTIVMVTGSVGKTSTKDAVAAALGSHTYLRASEKSYNTEFGVPLTIIGVKNPWTSIPKWMNVFEQVLILLLFKNHYPKTLVLEVGADRPGDLARIMRIATPDAVVVTRLPEVPVHVEAYASTAAVRDEEFTPAFSLAPGAPLILASNNEYALTLGKKTQARIYTFGLADTAEVAVRAPQILEEKGRVLGMKASIRIDGVSHPVTLLGAIGRQQLLAPAAALATAHALNIPITEALSGLAHYTPPPGRARLLSGKNNSLIIDDSYNSSPSASEEALRSLGEIPHVKRRIAVLGDMLELGRYSHSEHERIGTLAAACSDVLVTVGARCRAMRLAALAAGFTEEQVHCFDTAYEAAEILLPLIQEGDAILIKGSQSMRMERVVEALLLNPEDARLLVRQEKEWKKRK